MSRSYILRAFLEGADGVFISGCHIGDCHYINGNEKAYLRMEYLKELITKIGIEQGRIEIHQISASEGKIFADKISQFTENVKKLGKSKLNKKKEPLGVLI